MRDTHSHETVGSIHSFANRHQRLESKRRIGRICEMGDGFLLEGIAGTAYEMKKRYLAYPRQWDTNDTCGLL